MIVLRGLAERAFGNYVCIRGYAKLGDLVNISRTEPHFQRELNQEHKENISKFYDYGKNVFFSEVILGLDVNPNVTDFKVSDYTALFYEDKENKNAVMLLENKLINNGSSKNFDGREKESFVILKIKEEYIIENKPFIRIDGNHRLQAVDLESTKKDLLCPFCLILFNDYDTEASDNNRERSIIFHNINAKALPLTSEENLKGIFNSANYVDDELEQDLGWEYVLTRKLHNRINFEDFEHLKKVFADKSRSTLLELIQFLITKEVISTQSGIEPIYKAIQKTEPLYNDNSELSDDKTVFIAIVYKVMKDLAENDSLPTRQQLKKTKAFIKWAIANYLCEAKLHHPNELIAIYDRLHDNEVKIFMAMPYYEGNSVSDYNDALNDTVKKIREANPHIKLTNYTIMANHSPTHNIVHDIFEKIKNCDIFIADITDNNANVLYEYGYAKGKEKPCILLLNKDKKKEEVKSDYGLDLRFEFQGYKDLKSKLNTEIVSVLNALGFIENT